MLPFLIATCLVFVLCIATLIGKTTITDEDPEDYAVSLRRVRVIIAIFVLMYVWCCVRIAIEIAPLIAKHRASSGEFSR